LPRITDAHRIPAVVHIDENNNCKVMIKNCAPYEVTIERNDLMGLVEIKEDELIPLTDNTAAKICATIKENIPKTSRARLSQYEIARCCNLQVRHEFREK
jgi:hypothetical protein